MILRRNEEDGFSHVVREWASYTAVLLGGGLSLTLEQVAQVRAKHQLGAVRCIAVNDAYLWAEFADVLYAADSQWWGWQAAGLPKPMLGLSGDQVRERYENFGGQRCSIQYAGSNVVDQRVHILRNKHHPNRGVGLSMDQGALGTGRNSGFQAINLAVLAGAKKIVLLGIDGRPGHFHGGHPRPTPDSFYEVMRKAFSEAEDSIREAGVTVLNASPGSSIDSFPKVELQAALGH